MENQTTPCKALVLAGGGARGSYQVGVWKALMELDWHPQIITGTSVGSLNGAMFVLDLYEVARDMWLTIRSKDVMELPEENADLSALHSFLRSVVKAGGMDVSPLEEIVERVLDEDALRRANIRFGLVTVEQRGLKARELTLDEIPQGRVKDYLMASAACFPALRAREIDGVKFLDGGYSDNMPTCTLPPIPPAAMWSWVITTPCGPLAGCGAAPMPWTTARTAAPMLPRSGRGSMRCRRPCGRNTP